MDVGGIPPQGGAENIGKTVMDLGGRYLVIPSYVGGSLGGRLGGYVDLNLQAIEYGCKIHCEATYSRHFPGGGAESGIAVT